MVRFTVLEYSFLLIDCARQYYSRKSTRHDRMRRARAFGRSIGRNVPMRGASNANGASQCAVTSVICACTPSSKTIRGAALKHGRNVHAM